MNPTKQLYQRALESIPYSQPVKKAVEWLSERDLSFRADYATAESGEYRCVLETQAVMAYARFLDS